LLQTFSTHYFEVIVKTFFRPNVKITLEPTFSLGCGGENGLRMFFDLVSYNYNHVYNFNHVYILYK